MSKTSDQVVLERLRDKCHMIIEAVEDACLDEGESRTMVRMYQILKEAYRTIFGEPQLCLLLTSMELNDNEEEKQWPPYMDGDAFEK